VSELLAVNVLPSAIVKVEPVAGAVNATLLMLVAVATPNAGVVRVGLVRVLFVSVSVVARPTKVSVAAGNVRVVVPAVAVANNVVVPEVDPAKIADVPNDRVVSIVADPYILVPESSLAIVFYLFVIFI
jgi:hypothetical protein